jgi:hypothetical protein
MESMIKIVTAFGMALLERQHQFFLDETLDNSEHISAIKRIADTAYSFLKAKGASLVEANSARKDLINHGRNFFVERWMTSLEEDEEALDEEDRREAKRTFDKLLKENSR